MALSSTVSRNEYTATGSLATYSYTFKIFSNTDLLVTVRSTSNVETTLTLTTDYTVSGVGATNGGSITLVAGNLTAGYILTIRRVRPITQAEDFRNQDDFFPENHEDAFDKATMVDQQLQDLAGRSIHLPETISSSDFDPTLPTNIAAGANQSIIVNSTGTGLTLGSVTTTSPSTPLPPSQGGTGISNPDAATLTRVGANPVTLTTTGTTNLTLPTSGTLATLAGTEAFTNKDIDGGTAANNRRITLPKDTLANLQALTRKQGTMVFATDSLKPFIDNGTVLSAIGSGSGSGNINYLLTNGYESDFEDGLTTGYATYLNTTPASTPEVSPGGSPSANVTFTNTSSAPLRLTKSGLITKDAANRQGTGVRTSAITIDNTDVGKTLTLSFDFDASNANYASGDIGIFISDGTNIITPSVTALPNGKGNLVTQFTTTTSTSYRIYWHMTTTNASAYTVKIDTVILGPLSAVTSPAVQDWISYIPTITGFGTVSATDVRYKRIGDTMQVRGNFTMGTPAAATASISLPSGFALDTTKLSNAATNHVGMTDRVSTTASYPTTSYGSFPIMVDPSTSTTVVYLSNGGTATNAYQKTNGSSIASSAGELHSFQFEVPIATWTSNVVIGSSREEYAFNTTTDNSNDTTSFGNGPAGTLIPNRSVGTSCTKRVRFQRPIQASDFISIEFLDTDNSNSTIWQPIFQTEIDCFHSANAVNYGINTNPVSSSLTDLDIVFGNGGYSSNAAATYGANGNAWSSLFSSNYRWRVRKSSGPSVFQAYDYAEGSFSAVFSSGAGAGGANTTKTITYKKVGKLVTLIFPSMTDMTAGATTFVFSTGAAPIPTFLWPSTNQNFLVAVNANGAALDTAGELVIGNAGNIFINRTVSGGTNFTATQTNNGMQATCVTYGI